MKPIQRFFLYCFYCTLAYFTKDSTGYADDVYYAHKCCVGSDKKLVNPEDIPTKGCSGYIYPGEKTSDNSDWCRAGYFIPATGTDDTYGFHQLCYDSFLSLMGDDYKTGNAMGNSDCHGREGGMEGCRCTYVSTVTGSFCQWNGCKYANAYERCINGGYRYESGSSTGFDGCTGGYYWATGDCIYDPNDPKTLNCGCEYKDGTKSKWGDVCRPCKMGLYSGGANAIILEKVDGYSDHPYVGVETCAIQPSTQGIEDQYGWYTYENPGSKLKGNIICSYKYGVMNDNGEGPWSTGFTENE